MNSKTEKKKLKELRKENKKTLKQRSQDLMAEHEQTVVAYKTIDTAHRQLTASLIDAINADDKATIELLTSKIGVLDKELDRLSKRDKTLTEEIELISRASKNDFEGQSSKWTTVGAWVIGSATTALSAIGLWKSHKAFNEGSLVDKGTKSLAERLNGLFSFTGFFRNQ